MGTLMDSLTTKIQKAEQRFDDAAQTTVQRAVELGKLLAEAKAKIGHGGWEAWCQETFGGRRSQSWIQNVMKVARDCEQNPELLRLQSLRAITAASKPDRSKEPGASSKARRAGHLETEVESHESVEEESADAQEQMDSLPSALSDPSGVSEEDTDYLSAAAIARRVVDDLKRLKAIDDPIVAEMLDEVRNVAGVSTAAVLTISEGAVPVATKQAQYSAEEAMTAIASIEVSLRPGQKRVFKDQMVRRWAHGETVRKNSQPKDYMPMLPNDETALPILNREFQHRLLQLMKIDPSKFRRIAEKKMLKDVMNKARKIVDQAEKHISSEAGRRSLFDGEDDNDALAASA